MVLLALDMVVLVDLVDLVTVKEVVRRRLLQSSLVWSMIPWQTSATTLNNNSLDQDSFLEDLVDLLVSGDPGDLDLRALEAGVDHQDHGDPDHLVLLA